MNDVVWQIYSKLNLSVHVRLWCDGNCAFHQFDNLFKRAATTTRPQFKWSKSISSTPHRKRYSLWSYWAASVIVRLGHICKPRISAEVHSILPQHRHLSPGLLMNSVWNMIKGSWRFIVILQCITIEQTIGHGGNWNSRVRQSLLWYCCHSLIQSLLYCCKWLCDVFQLRITIRFCYLWWPEWLFTISDGTLIHIQFLMPLIDALITKMMLTR